MADTKRIDDPADGATQVDGPRLGATAPLAREPEDARGPVPAPQDVRLREVIGSGGMGRVFRGEQITLARPVAFKQLLDTSNMVQRERFLREAQITAQLDHPNIVPIHSLDVSTEGGVVGYAMKLVEGKTLRALLVESVAATERGERLDREHARTTLLDHFLKICDAVAFAHARGILHRDLKPPNIMIGRFGEVYVMDWGIARGIGRPEEHAEEDAEAEGPELRDLTRLGQIVGTPAYMSPEQANGRNAELDARSDQYALGLILMEIATLRRALDGKTEAELLEQAKKGRKAPFVHLSKRERVPVELRAIIDKATALDPEDRYPDVLALAQDLRRFMRGDAVRARPDTPLETAVRWTSRHGRAMLATLFAITVLSAAAVGLLAYRKARGELEARKHGDALTALYVDVAAQSRRVDAEFQRMEEALEGLRTAAEWALTGPPPGGPPRPIFFETDFADPARRPKDFTRDTAYRWPVSVDAPVVAVARGTDRQALLPRLARLAPLRDHMADMIVAAGEADPRAMSPEEKRRFLLQRKSPIDYAYVSLPEGVQFMLPGMDSMPPGYDVRTAGFYTMSANKTGRRWGAPYVDATTDALGDDLVLPCTQGLWSPTGVFIGVAGVEITVTKLVKSELVLPGRTTLRTSLLDRDGKKVVDSSDADRRFKTNGKDEGLALADFDVPEIVAAVRRGEQGIRELASPRRIVAFARLDVLGWTYVVELDPAALPRP